MKLANVFTNLLNDVPNIYAKSSDWFGWIGINKDTDAIQDDVMIYKGFDARDYAHEEVTGSGQYKTMDWAKHPTWFDANYWWRIWIPVGWLATPSPWFSDLDEPTQYDEVQPGSYKFFPDQKAEMESDFECLDWAIAWMIGSRQLGCQVPFPPAYRISRLSRTYTGSSTFQREGADAALLNRIRWIRWFYAVVPDARGIIPQDVQKAAGLAEDGFGAIGCILNIKRNLSLIDFGLLIKRDIPTYFTWSEVEDGIPRFSRIHPKLMALEHVVEENEVVTHDLEYTDVLKEKAKETWLYDNYF